MSFASKVVLAAGGTGNVGNGAVSAFLKQGATVIAPVRSESGAQKLRAKFADYSDRLHTPIADISDAASAAQLKQQLSAQFPHGLDHVVSSSGPWWNQYAFHDLDYKIYRDAFAANLDAHVVLYLTFAAQLLDKPGSSWTIVTGGAGNDTGKFGLVGLTQYALFGFSEAVRAQTREKLVRVNELRIAVRIESDEEFAKISEPSSFQTHSAYFGSVFAAIARGDAKSEVIKVNKLTEVEELMAKW